MAKIHWSKSFKMVKRTNSLKIGRPFYSDGHNVPSVNTSSSFCVVNEAWVHISLPAHFHNYYSSHSITVALLAV